VDAAAASGETWIGYEDGEVERWRGEGDTGETVSLPVAWPNDRLVDIAAGGEGVWLFGCTESGEVIRVSIADGTETMLHSAGWSGELGAAYVPESADTGYLLDRLGTVHHIGRTAIFTRYTGGRPAPMWKGGWARDLCMEPGGSGLLLLDAFGGVHRLGAGSGTVSAEGLAYYEAPIAQRILAHEGRLLLMDGRGRISASRGLPDTR